MRASINIMCGGLTVVIVIHQTHPRFDTVSCVVGFNTGMDVSISIMMVETN